MVPYFPVTSRYQVPGPVYSLGEPEAGKLCIEVDENWPRYRAEKVAQRAQGTGPLRTPGLSEAAERAVATWLESQAAASISGPARTALSGVASLSELIAGLQEDLVILARDSGARAASAQAVYVDVSFPSGWCPECAVGRDFLSLHEPVPTTGQFGPVARPGYANALFAQGIRVRYVWTVTPDDRLDRRHCHHEPPHGTSVPGWANSDSVFLRVERQVIVPIDTQTCAFLIRIHQHPVSALTGLQRATLMEALQSMPDSVAIYKGLHRYREQILALL